MAYNKDVLAAYKAGLEGIHGRLIGAHQHEGVKWMLKQELDSCFASCPGGILADDCGCGKTYMATCVMQGNKVAKTLIVTVVSVVHQWRDIMMTFGKKAALVVTGECYMGCVPEGTEVVITTYSSFAPKKKGGKVASLFTNTCWNRVILDEGHVVKNQKSITYTNIALLNARIKWVLTATPVQNSLKDLETLARWIGWMGSLDNFIGEKLLRRTLAREGEINPRMKLPDLQTEIIKLDFKSENERQVYKRVEEEFRMRVENMKGGSKLYTEALEGILRCRQVCCSPEIYQGSAHRVVKRKRKRCCVIEDSSDDERDEMVRGGDSTKIQYICDDISTNGGKEKCLIFCMWTLEIKLVIEALQARNIACLKFDGSMTNEKREAALYNFRHTEGVRALVVQIQAGGVGLNLQCATRVYITSPTWNPTHEIQAISRSHRLGQNHIVKCFRLVINDTVEERIMEIQGNKLSLIAETLDDLDVLKKMNVDTIDMGDLVGLFQGGSKTHLCSQPL